MTSRFKPVTLEFKGKQYTVEPTRMMGLIDAIEEHITLPEIHEDGAKRRTMRFGKLSAAYTAALNYAGCPANREEVYLGMFEDGAGDEAKAYKLMMALLTIMTPPDSVVQKMAKGDNKSVPQGAGENEPGLSKKHSLSRRERRKLAAGK